MARERDSDFDMDYTPAPAAPVLADLPAPPVPADCDLRSFPDFPLSIQDLRNSGMQVEVEPAAGWFAINLWCASFHQVPASSLPDDDAILAYLAGLGRDVRTWRKMRKAGALRGWVKCSDNRLYNPKVSEKAIKAWNLKRNRARGAELTNAMLNNGSGERPAIRSADARRYAQRTHKRTQQRGDRVEEEETPQPPSFNPDGYDPKSRTVSLPGALVPVMRLDRFAVALVQNLGCDSAATSMQPNHDPLHRLLLKVKPADLAALCIDEAETIRKTGQEIANPMGYIIKVLGDRLQAAGGTYEKPAPAADLERTATIIAVMLKPNPDGSWTPRKHWQQLWNDIARSPRPGMPGSIATVQDLDKALGTKGFRWGDGFAIPRDGQRARAQTG